MEKNVGYRGGPKETRTTYLVIEIERGIQKEKNSPHKRRGPLMHLWGEKKRLPFKNVDGWRGGTGKRKHNRFDLKPPMGGRIKARGWEPGNTYI